MLIVIVFKQTAFIISFIVRFYVCLGYFEIIFVHEITLLARVLQPLDEDILKSLMIENYCWRHRNAIEILRATQNHPR